jgi:hypothetical protein
MEQRVKFVGGPKDGEDYPWTTCRFVSIPDARDMIHFVSADGESGTIFGEHTYEMKCYANGDQREYRLEYVDHKPARLGPGKRPIVFP